MKNKLIPALLVAVLAFPAFAEVKLSKLFSPHMVLQREIPVAIWGTAAPGEKVTVKFRDQTKTAEADKDGKWSVKLDALKPGGPDALTINDKTVDDVLVGDVWVGSGQSNMDMLVSNYAENDPVLKAAAAGTYPKLRLLSTRNKDPWLEATPANNVRMSALLFSFGFALQKEVDVPIGIMVGAVGGTPSGYWLSEEMYREDADCAAAAAEFGKTYDYDKALAKYNADKAKYDVEKAKYDQEFAAWKPLADAAKKDGKPIPPAPPGPRAPGQVAKAGEATGGKIGNLFENFIRPYVGYGIKGVLWDQGESRTAIVGVEQIVLMGALIKGWRKAWGQGDFPFIYVQKPSGGGCAWDYESPLSNKADKFAKLPAAIPGPPDAQYSHVAFAQLMKYPNTHMAIGSDLGSGIHPSNKSAYGARAAQVAFAVAYGKKNEYLGPVYAAHEIQGDKVVLKFTHSGQGLAFKNGDKLQGFMVAGEDKKFVWADAVIDGETVVVSSKTVPKPAAARYAWSNTFPWANLFNKDGLPAQPFRTDSW